MFRVIRSIGYLMVVAIVLSVASVAQAGGGYSFGFHYGHGGYHQHGWHHHGWHHRYDHFGYYWPWPYFYAPPVYYADPPPAAHYVAPREPYCVRDNVYRYLSDGRIQWGVRTRCY